MISVIVPAHDEEAVIGRCLESLCRGAEEGELEVIVACNGCRDATARIARGYGSPVRVVESPVASKVAALNLGEEVARGFPRFYLDADVVLPLDSLRRVARALERGPCLVAAPRLRVDVEGASRAVRAYYEIWTRLPYISAGLIGSGVYALSEEGRRRFERFPEIISDDGFVRLHFRPEERESVASAWFRITAPRRLRDLVRIKVRSQKGARQLLRRFPELARNEVRSYGSPLREILASPRLWPCLALYAWVMLQARLRAWTQLHVTGLGAWERDDSSRRAATGVWVGDPEARRPR